MRDIAYSILLSGSIAFFGCREQSTEPPPSNLPLEIAFTSDQSGNDDVYVMASDGSNQTRLTTNPDRDWFPKWSRNGRQIAFLSTRNGDTQLYVMNSDGSNQLKLSAVATFITGYDDIQWSPTGRFIAFTAFDDRNVERIYVVNADGTNQKMLTAGSFPNWLQTENRLICGGNGIFSINVDGSNSTRLTDSTFHDFYPTLSPSEDKIAFRSTRDNDTGSASLHIMNIDGTGIRELTNKDSNIRPTWTPSGSAILFLSPQLLIGRKQIYRVDTSGGNEVMEVDLGDVSSPPSFSPSGDRIVFSSIPDSYLRTDIYVKNLNTSTITRLTSNTNVLFPRNKYPDWKPQ